MSPDVLSYALRSGIRANAGETVTLHANWFAGSTPWSSFMGMPDPPVMFASGYLAKAQ